MSINDSEIFVPESDPLTVHGLIEWLKQFDEGDRVTFSDTLAGNRQRLQDIKPEEGLIVLVMQEPTDPEN